MAPICTGGQFKKKEACFEQVSASLSCKFTCQEHWNYLEMDGVNICAGQVLRQGRAVGAAEPPSPLCLQMLHGMPEEGWCNPTCTPTHILLQGDCSKHPKIPRRGGWNSGNSPWQLAGCKFSLGEYWSNWAQQYRIGFGETHTSPTPPAPLHLPVKDSPDILGHYEAFQPLSQQPLNGTSKPPPAAAPSYQNLPVHAQNNPHAGANCPLRHKQISAQVLFGYPGVWQRGAQLCQTWVLMYELTVCSAQETSLFCPMYFLKGIANCTPTSVSEGDIDTGAGSRLRTHFSIPLLPQMQHPPQQTAFKAHLPLMSLQCHRR